MLIITSCYLWSQIYFYLHLTSTTFLTLLIFIFYIYYFRCALYVVKMELWIVIQFYFCLSLLNLVPFIFTVLKNRLRHIKHFKCLFKQKLIGIRQCQTGSGWEHSTNSRLLQRKSRSNVRKLLIGYSLNLSFL